MQPIVVTSLSKFFKVKGQNIQALHDVSFSVNRGESVGFIGQNGAGKSTSIKILFGAMRADSGQALLMGRTAHDPRSRQNVGYVPENAYLYDQLTPREVVSSGLKIHGIGGLENTRRTEHWLERLEIAYAANKRIRDLSKGMAQRTALAHAFALQPELLVLDEPMSGLDPIGRRQVADLMQEYRQEGGTLFFSTHILHDVERLADRFVMIHKGRISAQQSMTEMLASQEFLQVRYHGEHGLEGFSQDAQALWKGLCKRDELAQLLTKLSSINAVFLDAHPQNSLENIFEGIALHK